MPIVFSRFQQLTLEEGLLSLIFLKFFFFLFIEMRFVFKKKLNHTCLIKCFGEDGCTNSTVIVFYYYYKSFPSCPLLPIFVFLSKKMSLLSVHDGQRVDNPKDLGVKPSGGESCLDC